jgi:hypothetical protein
MTAIVSSRGASILVQRYRLTARQAFAVLARVSQEQNRKLADIAREPAETGAVPDGDAGTWAQPTPMAMTGRALGCSQRISFSSEARSIATQPAVGLPLVMCRKNADPAPRRPSRL